MVFSLFGNSLKWKLWKRRLSISAPRMAIRTQASWPMRLLMVIVVVLLGGLLAMRAYEFGRDLTGFKSGMVSEHLERLKDQVEQLRHERNAFSATANAAESQINIERAAQKQLVTQVKALEAENIKLKEDLAFFERLLPADTGPQGVSIRRLTVDTVSVNQLRYRMLIMQGGKGDRDFVGNLQLLVTMQKNGSNPVMVFPNGKADDAEKFKLVFRHYQRVEGIVTLPEGVSIKAVQARILEKGQLRAQQSANL
jgi:outer membrane murein-binding lipoprotein Lpp